AEAAAAAAAVPPSSPPPPPPPPPPSPPPLPPPPPSPAVRYRLSALRCVSDDGRVTVWCCEVGRVVRGEVVVCSSRERLYPSAGRVRHEVAV
ncbi:hypothetical protein HN011_006394, partial [Eciton burchellii]